MPVLIIVNTILGKNSAYENTNKIHGKLDKEAPWCPEGKTAKDIAERRSECCSSCALFFPEQKYTNVYHGISEMHITLCHRYRYSEQDCTEKNKACRK